MPQQSSVMTKVRMMADGSATFTKALGLELDLVACGMGVRPQRYSMLVDNSGVKALNVEAPGQVRVSRSPSPFAAVDPAPRRSTYRVKGDTDPMQPFASTSFEQGLASLKALTEVADAARS